MEENLTMQQLELDAQLWWARAHAWRDWSEALNQLYRRRIVCRGEGREALNFLFDIARARKYMELDHAQH